MSVKRGNNYAEIENAKGVSGMGINRSGQRLPYEMIMLMKKFLLTIKKGE